MIASRPALAATLTLTAFVAFAQTAKSQEWTRFRGPNGSGIGDAPSMPTKFNESDFEWIIELPGTGHSSPVLWGKKLFLTVAAKDKDKHQVLCLDSETGKELWKWSEDYTAHNKHNFNDFASSTPVVDEHAVYLTWTSGEETRALALDHAGKEIWACSWVGFTSDHGSAASPVLIDGVLVIHTDGKDDLKSYIYGVNPADGAEIWRRERITSANDEKHLTAYSTPVVSTSGGRTCIVLLSTNHGWLGLDPANGEEIWSFDDEYTYRSVGSIAESDGILFASLGSGGGGKQSAALKLNGTSKPDLLYSLDGKAGLSYVPTPIIHEGLLYLWGDGGVLACRDAMTGEEIYKERAGNGQFFSSPVLVDGKLYGASRDGLVVVIKAGRDFEKLAENKLDSGINATPAIANGRMFIRTDQHLMSLKGGK